MAATKVPCLAADWSMPFAAPPRLQVSPAAAPPAALPFLAAALCLSPPAAAPAARLAAPAAPRARPAPAALYAAAALPAASCSIPHLCRGASSWTVGHLEPYCMQQGHLPCGCVCVQASNPERPLLVPINIMMAGMQAIHCTMAHCKPDPHQDIMRWLGGVMLILGRPHCCRCSCCRCCCAF